MVTLPVYYYFNGVFQNLRVLLHRAKKGTSDYIKG